MQKDILSLRYEQERHRWVADQIREYIRRRFWEIVVVYQAPVAQRYEPLQANVAGIRGEVSSLHNLLNESPLYFARLDVVDGQQPQPMLKQVYVGKQSFWKDQDQLIYDWRAPICSLYYRHAIGRLTYIAPDGPVTVMVTLRRTYEWNQEIRVAESQHLPEYYGRGYEYPADSASISVDRRADPFLQRMLSRKTAGQMREIVQTIAAEQDEVIRCPNEHVLVTGAAGTGKTAVILHRLAYLLYAAREARSEARHAHLGANDDLGTTVFVTHSQVLLDYASRVLTELRERNPMLLSLDLLFASIVREISTFFQLSLRTESREAFNDRLLKETSSLAKEAMRIKNCWCWSKYVSNFVSNFDNKLRTEVVDVINRRLDNAEVQNLNGRLERIIKKLESIRNELQNEVDELVKKQNRLEMEKQNTRSKGIESEIRSLRKKIDRAVETNRTYEREIDNAIKAFSNLREITAACHASITIDLTEEDLSSKRVYEGVVSALYQIDSCRKKKSFVAQRLTGEDIENLQAVSSILQELRQAICQAWNPARLWKDFWNDEAVWSTIRKHHPNMAPEVEEIVRRETSDLEEYSHLWFDDLGAFVYLCTEAFQTNTIRGALRYYRKASHFIVDEAQDLAPIHHVWLRRQIIGNKNVSVAADHSQNILPFGSSAALLKGVYKIDNHFVLRFSYRSTMEIIRFALKLSGQNLDVEAVRHSGNLPVLMRIEVGQRLYAQVGNLLAQLQRAYNSVAIVCMDNQQAEKVYTEISSRIEYGQIPASIKDNMKLLDSNNQRQGKLSGIFVSTISAVKGLEFDAVIVWYASDRTSLQQDTQRRLLYIGCTRALHRLYFLCEEIPTDLRAPDAASLFRLVQQSDMDILLAEISQELSTASDTDTHTSSQTEIPTSQDPFTKRWFAQDAEYLERQNRLLEAAKEYERRGLWKEAARCKAIYYESKGKYTLAAQWYDQAGLPYDAIRCRGGRSFA